MPYLQDFGKSIAKIKPPRNRESIVKILDGNWDFKAWVEQLPIRVSGLVPNPQAADDQMQVAHSWRFIRRSVRYLACPVELMPGLDKPLHAGCHIISVCGFHVTTVSVSLRICPCTTRWTLKNGQLRSSRRAVVGIGLLLCSQAFEGFRTRH